MIKRLLLSFVALLLFVPDLTAATGARLLADLNPGAVGSYPSNFSSFGGTLYFSAYTLSTGTELWKYDGTNITLAADINPTADDIGFGIKEGNDSIPDWLTEFDGQLFFSAFHPGSGGELWRYDGNQAVRVSDINPDLDPDSTNSVLQNSAWPYQLTVFNDSLYFGATSATRPEDYELWRFDAGGAREVTDLHPDIGTDHSSYPTGLTTFNGALYFMAYDGTHGWELWKHDGIDTKLFDLNPGGAESSSYPKEFTPFNNELYFSAYTEAAGFELWRTDGTTATLASDVQAGAESSSPTEFTAYNGALYFQAFEASTGYELRKFSGGQVSLAADVNTGGDSYPKHLMVFGDLLVFAADDGVNGWELWKYDGATASIVTNLNAAGDSFPEEFTVLDGALYFVATTPETGYEIWKFDGTTVSLAAEVNEGPGDSFPRNLTAIGGRFYFSATEDGVSNWEPWVLESAVATNQPPLVSLTAPTSGATFLTTDPISFSADATDDSGVARVEFYANDALIATDNTAPYAASTNLAAGAYAITARAFDTAGLSTTSTESEITVAAAQPTVSVSRDGLSIVLTATVTSGVPHTIQGSADLVNWTTIQTVTPADGTITFTETASESRKFYRVVAQ